MMSKEKTMNLELLPNEIFLDLFGYFDGTDLLRAFYGLNSRFNLLLYKECRSYYFCFDFMSKRDFDLICQQHLPFIADQVRTLRLIDHYGTPNKMNLFFSYTPSFGPFIHLRSLALFHFQTYEILLKLLDECQHLPHLNHLKFCSYSFSNTSAGFQLIINKIWSLPKLTNCYLTINIDTKHVFCIPTILSTSLEYVTIFPFKFQQNELNQLFEYTPRLKHLSIDLNNSVNDDHIAYSYPTLIRLKIHFGSSINLSQMIAFFQSTPHLGHLDIDTGLQLINGHQWEEIIRNYLPQLKTLRLKMVKSFYHGENIQQEADNLLDSFRSPFWIDKHQWFVRCITRNRKIHLQTLSSISNYSTQMIPDSWQSTDPHDNQQEMYKNITRVYSHFFEQPISSNIRLSNIIHLHMKLPIKEQFWSIVPNLDKLESLTVLSHTDTFQSQLQTLLDQAPRLHTFVINQDALLPLQMSLFTYTNESVRKLDLRTCNHDFDEEKCLNLTGSPLGIQCEILLIRVHNRQSIIHLVKNMLHLRSLTVKCAEDKARQRSVLTKENDELVQWLKRHLSSLYMIVRDFKNANILIWM